MQTNKENDKMNEWMNKRMDKRFNYAKREITSRKTFYAIFFLLAIHILSSLTIRRLQLFFIFSWIYFWSFCLYLLVYFYRSHHELHLFYFRKITDIRDRKEQRKNGDKLIII